MAKTITDDIIKAGIDKRVKDNIAQDRETGLHNTGT